MLNTLSYLSLYDDDDDAVARVSDNTRCTPDMLFTTASSRLPANHSRNREHPLSSCSGAALGRSLVNNIGT